ncbi:MAG: 3-oxoacyl-[acyl-carrier-protein] reductase [Calditrichaeota bacterium]|nr:MAG: 3-oxoacyl-[acyl-carrier-protein] reductase [Calditrichota bacterium]
MSFKEQVVIVTGASRGIGRAIAAAFAAENAHVVLTGRNEATLQEAVEGIQPLCSGEIVYRVGDVSRAGDAEAIVQSVMEKFGKVDVLVNNAGITRDNILMRMKEEEWDAVLNTNLKGAFNCLKAVTRPMMKKRSGVIINITSVVGQMGNAGQANYAASKAGMIGLTKSAAKELASRHIRVNAVAPGFIETDMTAHLPEKAREELVKSIPLGTLGQPEDVARAVLFLSSPKAQYITGQVVNVDGGMIM